MSFIFFLFVEMAVHTNLNIRNLSNEAKVGRSAGHNRLLDLYDSGCWSSNNINEIIISYLPIVASISSCYF